MIIISYHDDHAVLLTQWSIPVVCLYLDHKTSNCFQIICRWLFLPIRRTVSAAEHVSCTSSKLIKISYKRFESSSHQWRNKALLMLLLKPSAAMFYTLNLMGLFSSFISHIYLMLSVDSVSWSNRVSGSGQILYVFIFFPSYFKLVLL